MITVNNTIAKSFRNCHRGSRLGMLLHIIHTFKKIKQTNPGKFEVWGKEKNKRILF